MADQELARRVRAARTYAGITQEDMASRLDMSTVTYKRIEQAAREVSVGELKRVSEITGWPEAMFHGEFGGGAASGDGSSELEQLRSDFGELIARLADLEWRMRENVTGKTLTRP